MFDPRTEVTDTNENYVDAWGKMNYGAKAKKAAQNYENYRNWNGGGLQFRPNDQKMEEEEEQESGVCSPPLWNTSLANPVHPPRLPGQNNNYRYLSPTSKTQAIARGQWELMEMVKNMPESCYELSLKDLVEHPRLVENSTLEESSTTTTTARNSMADQEQALVSGPTMNQRVKSKKIVEKKAKMMTRSGSIDNNGGLFLKMVFPISFGSSPKKRKNQAPNPFARVAPKPLEVSMENSSSSKSCVEKDWWKKKNSGSGGSESGVTSSSNGGSSSTSSSSTRSNSGRKKSSCLPACWSPFHSQ